MELQICIFSLCFLEDDKSSCDRLNYRITDGRGYMYRYVSLENNQDIYCE